MIVAVTGGSGFIGAALVRRLLERGHTVRVLSRRGVASGCALVTGEDNLQLFRGDLLDPDGDFKAFVEGADVLYHCAGEIRDPALMPPLHVEGTKRLVAAAAGHVGHWVQLSSVGAYGSRQTGIVTEETPTAPVGVYETTKTIADELVAAAAGRNAFRCTIVRPSNVIAPSMPNRSVFQLIAAIHRGRFVFIGKPGGVANYIHLDNVVEALLLAGDIAPAALAVYNVSDACSFEQFVSDVCGALRCPQPRLRIPKWGAEAVASMFGAIPGFPLTPSRVRALTTRTIYATSKIEAELHYMPLISMREAVTQMATAWLSNDHS